MKHVLKLGHTSGVLLCISVVRDDQIPQSPQNLQMMQGGHHQIMSSETSLMDPTHNEHMLHSPQHNHQILQIPQAQLQMHQSVHLQDQSIHLQQSHLHMQQLPSGDLQQSQSSQQMNHPPSLSLDELSSLQHLIQDPQLQQLPYGHLPHHQPLPLAQEPPIHSQHQQPLHLPPQQQQVPAEHAPHDQSVAQIPIQPVPQTSVVQQQYTQSNSTGADLSSTSGQDSSHSGSVTRSKVDKPILLQPQVQIKPLDASQLQQYGHVLQQHQQSPQEANKDSSNAEVTIPKSEETEATPAKQRKHNVGLPFVKLTPLPPSAVPTKAEGFKTKKGKDCKIIDLHDFQMLTIKYVTPNDT